MQAVRPGGTRGFSLFELILVITIVGIISVAAGAIILPAIQSQDALGRRAALVEAAESAMRRVARDIRISVPNSVRTTSGALGGGANGFAIEMIPTADGGRYCSGGTANCDVAGGFPDSLGVLSIGSADTVFDILGCFRNGSFAPLSIATTFATSAYRLVVGSTDSGIYTATSANAVIAPAGSLTLSVVPHTGASPDDCGTLSATANTYNRHRVALTSHTFPTASPRQRVFVVEDAAAPVSYVCNFTAGTLTRYVGYRNGAAYSTAAQPTNPGAAPLNTVAGALVTNNISDCSSTSLEADVQSTGVVSIRLVLTSSGETIELLSQVQLDNSQ